MVELLRDDGFWLAFAVATIGVGVSVVSARGGWMAIAAPTVAVAASLLALASEPGLSIGLALGVVLVAGAGLLEEHTGGRGAQVAVLVAGALLVAGAAEGSALWMWVAGFVAVLVGAPCASVVDRRAPRLIPVLLLLSTIGIYVCVPDTEVPLVLLGAALPVALLALNRRARSSASTGAFVALMVAGAVVGGVGRPGAVVGGLACVGVLVLVPLAGWRARTPADIVVLIVTHGLLVLWVARVAGFRDSAVAAALLCVPAFAIAWSVLFATTRLRARSAGQ
jgi:hypothetical protein